MNKIKIIILVFLLSSFTMQDKSPEFVIGQSEQIALKIINETLPQKDGFNIKKENYYEASTKSYVTDYSVSRVDNIPHLIVSCVNNKIRAYFFMIGESDLSHILKFQSEIKKAPEYSYLGNGVFKALNVPAGNQHYEIYFYAKAPSSKKYILSFWAFSRKEYALAYQNIFINTHKEMIVEIIK